MGMDISISVKGKEVAYFRKFEPLAKWFAGDNCCYMYDDSIQYDRAIDFIEAVRNHLEGRESMLSNTGDYLYRWKYIKALALFEEAVCYGWFDKGMSIDVST